MGKTMEYRGYTSTARKGMGQMSDYSIEQIADEIRRLLALDGDKAVRMSLPDLEAGKDAEDIEAEIRACLTPEENARLVFTAMTR